MELLNQTAPDLIVCCNGAMPYANLKAVWPAEDVHFEQFRLNDTFTGPNLNSSQSGPKCLGYWLKLSDPQSLGSWISANGSLGCRCKRDYFGRNCVDQRAAHGANTQAGGSFKVFLFLAIVPLTFGLLAALGGLLCKLCCCQCRWDNGGSDRRSEVESVSASGESLSLCWCCFYVDEEMVDDGNLDDTGYSPPPPPNAIQTGRKSPWGRRRPTPTRISTDNGGHLAQSDTTQMLLAPVDFNFDLPPPSYRQIFAFDPSPPPYSTEEQLRDATTQTNL